ncbi:MAG: fibronectin type III domain-containing protein, partial [Flavobacteriaceae bacterium]|nr:fibronectin type III domain-containing protein [Flavobacteriaceae bacterium]
MRKITLLIAFILSIISYGQVTIGNGTNEVQGVPFDPYFGYSYGQSVYLASEINANGNITGLQWYFNGTTLLPNSQGLTIYLGHSTRTAFASTSDWEPITNLTQVYTGGITVTGPGWVTIIFDTPFAYNGTDNLIIAVDENMASYDASTDDFYNSAVTGNRSIFYRSDTTNPDPNGSLPTGTLAAFIPNVVLEGISPACVAPANLTANNVMPSSVDLSWSDPSGVQNDYEYVIQASGTGLPTGSGISITGTSVSDNTLTPNTNYEVYVRANCGAINGFSTWIGPITFTTPCNTVLAPYAEGFENAGAIPSCWSMSGSENWRFSNTGSG